MFNSCLALVVFHCGAGSGILSFKTTDLFAFVVVPFIGRNTTCSGAGYCTFGFWIMKIEKPFAPPFPFFTFCFCGILGCSSLSPLYVIFSF